MPYKSDFEPIVLLSTERSGSNLLRSILGTHSEIAAPMPFEVAFPIFPKKPELPAELSTSQLRAFVRDILIQKNFSIHPLDEAMPLKRVVNRINSSETQTYYDIQRALYEEYASIAGKPYWISKYDQLFYCLDDLFEYYDNLKVVYLVRDPRDVVLSFKSATTGPYHPFFTANKWAEEQMHGRELLESRFESTHLVRYEDLLENSEKVIEGVCRFLDVMYEPEMLYFYKSDKSEIASDKSHMLKNLSIPIKSDNYGKFHQQLAQNEIQLTEQVTRDYLTYFGYEITSSDSDLDDLYVDEMAFERADAKMERRHKHVLWKNAPKEMLTTFMWLRFKRYMILRYEILKDAGAVDGYLS